MAISSQINLPAGLQPRKEPKVLNEQEGDCVNRSSYLDAVKE
jgi:hypothetical protein